MPENLSALRVLTRDLCNPHLFASTILCVLLLAPTIGAANESATCSSSLASRNVAHLLFGRGQTDNGGITEADWSSFVSRELTPRFPDGFTVMDGSGQWLNPQHGVIREVSKVVLIALPGRDDDASRIDAAIDAYKHQFRVLSVGLIVESACVRF